MDEKIDKPEKLNPDNSKPVNPNFTRFMDWLEKFREESTPAIIDAIVGDRDKERELRDNNNKKAFIFIMTVISFLFVMWMASFINGDSETARDILLVFLGAGMGTGISSFLKS